MTKKSDRSACSNSHIEVANYDMEKFGNSIPFINFPSKWNVKISPPTGGAVVRFGVEYKKSFVSVYLDCYDQLGCYGSPYWEVYPYDDDVIRCNMEDVASLLKNIEQSLSQQEKKK